MTNVVLVGAQWGDEGKGKIIDFLTAQADLIVRYQGGNNAGHTVFSGDTKVVLHLIPSGILHPDKTCLIGNGVVINPRDLIGEIEYLESLNIAVQGRLKIAANAHCIMPYHIALDSAREARLGEGKIGTTGKGIGPAYVDKVQRTGIRMHDLCTGGDSFKSKLLKNLEEYNDLLQHRFRLDPLDFTVIYDDYTRYGDQLKKYLVNPVYYLRDAENAGRKILFEGAQGTALDVDFGTYPFVTSSNPSAGGVCTGTGVGPTAIQKVLGVTKAYTTRVGSGPFPSELDEALSEKVRQAGGEFGATTGRPRRCGWLDAVQLRHACLVNGLGELAVTKLDVLDHMDPVKIVTGYYKDGQTVKEFPTDMNFFNDFEVEEESWPGWKTDTTAVRSYAALPEAARKYLNRITELAGVPVGIVSVGPRRSQTFQVS